ncbi:aspartate/glutamate racemase family protein [Rhizobium sp. TRM95111]|uniref:aspartate/glutamate racemase family protein n=1 Tax=Rhizobium alarense TaxID=2846851 RepID=UPI001F253D82|nr:aspartate/glutamate racemase family protein [Rhizobium alarense]MCF3640545.1 aspartate/glutamate racemase family protein [Rhizobium alarense]
MKTIGLIGGMSFESTAVYYRMINEMVRQRLGGLHSAELLLHSVNFEEIVRLQKAGDWAAAARRLGAVAAGLETAGAGCVLICTNTMHLVADAVQGSTGAHLIHIIDETAAALKAAGKHRPLLLATRYTMEHGFYADRMAALGIDVMVPDADGRALVHDVIFNELCQGRIVAASRERLIALIERAKAAGADSIILGCTEICLILDPADLPLPGFDSTAIHARAAVDFALGADHAIKAA